jgi:hypothetical protein
MNGRDFMNCMIEQMEFDAKKSAELDKIYLDERKRLGLNNNESNNANSPFIQLSNKPAIYAENQITLTDSQFEKFLQMIERKLK